jgi:hypothetical protein
MEDRFPALMAHRLLLRSHAAETGAGNLLARDDRGGDMKRVVSILALTGAAVLWTGIAARAEDDLPAPTGRKIVLHGVDCSLVSDEICPDEQAVLDEALLQSDDRTEVVVQADTAHGTCAESVYENDICVAAIQNYLLAGGIAADQLEIQGSDDSPSDAASGTSAADRQLEWFEQRSPAVAGVPAVQLCLL